MCIKRYVFFADCVQFHVWLQISGDGRILNQAAHLCQRLPEQNSAVGETEPAAGWRDQHRLALSRGETRL